jgi:hypothetical protein
MIPQRVPLAADGFITREWYRFLEALFKASDNMASIPRRLVTGALSGSAAVLYTAGSRCAITAATLCNSTGGAVLCSVWLVRSGGTAGAGNVVLSAQSVAASATRVCTELVGQALEPGDQIVALGAGVALVVSGNEVQ